MKLISLNLWGGKQYEPLMDFIKKQANDTDIFCFQEVFDTNTNKQESFGFKLNLLDELKNILPNHKAYFAPCVDNYVAGAFQPNFTDFNLSWGQAIFISKKFSVSSEGRFFVFNSQDNFNPKDLNSLPRVLQYLTFTTKDKEFIICNLHGIWRKGKKIDHPTRISQSEQIIKFLDQYKGCKKIICGDFNLNIDTKSLSLLEKNMRNLIKEFKILTTRSRLYTWGDKFADYTLTSPDIEVLNFEVPNLDISDHLPMILEFN